MLDVLHPSEMSFAQEVERRRLARELHDSAIQSLTALVADLEYFRARFVPTPGEINTQLAEKVEIWQELARESLDSMRRVLGGLRTMPGLDAGLPRAVEALLAKMQSDYVRVEFECEDWPALLSDEQTAHIYAIVREVLTNISKHANAKVIRVCMFSFDRNLHMSITDDGVGMPLASVAHRGMCQKNGYEQGIVAMQERATLLGGHITLESRPGQGTRVDLEVPLPRKPYMMGVL